MDQIISVFGLLTGAVSVTIVFMCIPYQRDTQASCFRWLGISMKHSTPSTLIDDEFLAASVKAINGD